MTASVKTETTSDFLSFLAEQETFEIGGVSVGGRPGVRPTVMIGSMFYHGHEIVVNEDRGEFLADEAEKLIRQQEDYAARTGNPCMLDVVGATPEAIERYLEFASNATDMPLLIDGTTADVRISGLNYASRSGLINRVVYNSIQPETGKSELQALREAGVQNAIVLTYCLQDFTAKGRVHAVRELLPKIRDAGIQKLMIDTCVLDIATLGQACSSIYDVKNELGLPAGGGVHNAVSTWRGLKSKMGRQAEKPCVAAAAAAAVLAGADFVLYGPIEDAPFVFPAVAMLDTATSQIAVEHGDNPQENHPRFRIG